MKELSKNDFHLVEHLFDDLKYHISIKGVIEGSLQGRIFSAENNLSAVVETPQGFFLSDQIQDYVFLREMNAVFKQDLLPKLQEQGVLDYTVFYSQKDESENTFETLFEDLSLMKNSRMTFSNEMTQIGNELPEGIYPVDGELIARKDLEGLEDVIEEIESSWESIEEFLKRGFGSVAIQEDKIIGWCLTDWIVGNECEIGLETDPEYRRQGIGYKTATGTLILAKKRGIKRTGWQCWCDNEGSIATAISVGFKLLKEFPVYFGWANELNNLLINGIYFMFGKKHLSIPADYARSAANFAKALEQGWDWGWNGRLEWNCACMFYKSGQIQQAKEYYEKAVHKGWVGIEEYIHDPYVYTEEDWEEIEAGLR